MARRFPLPSGSLVRALLYLADLLRSGKVQCRFPARRQVTGVIDRRSRLWLELGLCGQRLPEFDLVPIQVIDPGKATVGFVHSFGVNLYSLLFQAVEQSIH